METGLLILWGAFAASSAVMAGKKGYNAGAWLVLGFLFGVFAVIVVAMLPDKNEDAEG